MLCSHCQQIGLENALATSFCACEYEGQCFNQQTCLLRPVSPQRFACDSAFFTRCRLPTERTFDPRIARLLLQTNRSAKLPSFRHIHLLSAVATLFLDAAFLLTVGSFLLTVELFYLQWTILAVLLTILAFCLQLELFCLQWESASNKGLKEL